MRRLAQDAALRETLGRAARDYWQRQHSIEAMADDYERVMRGVLGVREVHEVRGEGALPSHLRPDGDARLRALLAPFGMESPL